MDNTKNQKTRARNRGYPIVSLVLDNGTIIETVYDAAARRTCFALWENGSWRLADDYKAPKEQWFVPYSPDNNLIKHDVVLLPKEPVEYGSEEKLIADIQAFIRRYVDISPLFEKIATYYVLFSWIYDGFNELPYVRLRGDFGSGKTRFLLTVGSLCYKPVFASGASTVSPMFHILDAFRGTLIIDEGDFRFSDEKADIVKILNNGNIKGFPVLRTEISANKEFNPRAFDVFGPKLVATRGYYDDRALESRFISEEMGQGALRRDIPINLPSSYREEALEIRNKLLLFRFRNLGKRCITEDLVDRSIEPRLNQIFAPLMSVVDDPKLRVELRSIAKQYHTDILADRGMDIEAQVLEVIRDLNSRSDRSSASIKEIRDLFVDRHGAEYDRRITNKWVGMLVRKKLRLRTTKSHGVFVIPFTERPKLEQLYNRYGISKEVRDPK